MMSAEPAIPIFWNAATYGDATSSAEFHGRMTASRKIDPMKKTQIRTTTELVAFEIARSGSSDSAAAMVATSAPTIEKITTTMAENTAPTPFGKNPPCAYRLEKSRLDPGHSPNTYSDPITRKMMIAATLIPANQYSNSP